MRSGFLTSAAARGASIFKMADQSRHKSMDTLRGYVRDAEIFRRHAGDWGVFWAKLANARSSARPTSATSSSKWAGRGNSCKVKQLGRGPGFLEDGELEVVVKNAVGC